MFFPANKEPFGASYEQGREGPIWYDKGGYYDCRERKGKKIRLASYR